MNDVQLTLGARIVKAPAGCLALRLQRWHFAKQLIDNGRLLTWPEHCT
jgi:hypothetical protein